MLVLQREVDEEIWIGCGPDQIRIMVLSVRNGRVRLGIAAPAEVPVHRREVAERINGKDK